MIEKTGFYIIDSASLRVCGNIRIPGHKVFREPARRGKTSAGRFYGLRLHPVISHPGELAAVHTTAGNTDGRGTVSRTVKTPRVKLPGDRGYIGKEPADVLSGHGPEFITAARKNMKRKLSAFNRIPPRKRAVTEPVNGLLKNFFQIEHSRHRSVSGFAANLFSSPI